MKEIPTVSKCLVPAEPRLTLLEGAEWTVEDFRALDVYMGRHGRWVDLVLACPGITVLADGGSNVARSLHDYVEREWEAFRSRAQMQRNRSQLGPPHP